MQPTMHGLGSPTDAAATGDGSLIAIEKRIRALLGGVGSIRITDGTTEATVLDYTNSNPLAVRLTDTNGDYVAAGGGTQYTEDAVAPADPVGNTLMMTRDDQLSAVTEAEGDWSRARGTAKGALWVAIADSAGDPITSFGGGTQYTEDAASAADPVGNMLIARRSDSLSSEVTTDRDNIALNATSKGELYVKQSDSVAVTIAAAAASIAKAEDAGHTTGDTGAFVLAVRESTATDLSAGATDGDYEPLEVDASGRLWVNVGVQTPGTAAANLGKAEDAAHSSGDTGVMLLGVREATATDLSAGATDGDYEPLELDALGRLWVNAGAVTPGTAAGNLGKAEDAAHSSGDTGVMLLAVRESTATDLSAGNTNGDYEPLQVDANGRLWVTAQIDTSVTPGTGATNLGKAEDAAHTSGDVGVMALGVRASSPTDRSAGPTDGDYEPFGLNEKGAVWVTPTPSANGGCTTFMASGSDGSTALTSTAQAVKASAGTLYGYYIYNPNSSAQFVHFYNVAQANVTVGTTNPLMSLTIPATSAANLWMGEGVTFSNAGWSIAATSTAGGNGAPSSSLDAVVWYL